MPQFRALRAFSFDAARAASAAQPTVAAVGGPCVPTDPDAGKAARSPARLLIHAGDGVGAGRGVLACLLLRLRALVSHALRPRTSAPTGVRIDDLAGRQFFATDDARSTIDVPLPAGTYHVNVRLGHRLRRYTVTLEHGATFDLSLRLDSSGA
jgi:hypothetical protein